MPLDDSQKRVLKYNIQTPDSLRMRLAQTAKTEYLIQGLIPCRSLALLVGDSGLGKSPLLYQAAISVASGVPFLGRAVKQGSVLYLDCENGITQVGAIVERIAGHLGLHGPPDNLFLWNLNDCSDPWQVEDLLREARPCLVIVDPVTAIFRSIEENTGKATEAFQTLRSLMRELDCSVIGVHHTRKTDEKKGSKPKLEHAGLDAWFQEARGARALVNGSDVRLGIDTRGKGGLVMRGFTRVEGEMPIMNISRALGQDGEPIGYSLIVGEEFLDNLDQQNCYRALPEEFSFKEAKEKYKRGDQATKDFLMKCIGVGILKQHVRGGPYNKTSTTPQQERMPQAA